MPKEAIRLALREEASKRIRMGLNGVYVPKYARKNPCQWKYRGSTGKLIWLPFETMIDVMEFALDNAFIMIDGKFHKQIQGIPMGDPLSPGMTIGTTAWMERLMMDSIDYESKKFFTARRFMDDVLLFYAKTPEWDYERFLEDFQKSEWYWPPLKLEGDNGDVFLETQFFIENRKIRHRLKNVNEHTKKVWRYHHYESYSQYQQIKATLIACLWKVQNMASDDEQLFISGCAKLKEFELLSYPKHLRTYGCAVMAKGTGNTTWFDIRRQQ